MDKNTKKTGRFRRALLAMMGRKASWALIAFLLRKRIDKSHAGLPSDLDRASDILFILPESKVDMVFQLETLFAILGRFSDTSVTFLCPSAHASFVGAFKGAQIIKYAPDEFLLYGAEFNRVAAEFACRAFDICIMLEKEYTLPHLYLSGMSRAHIRIGWSDENVYPFLNVRIVPDDNETTTLWERNQKIAKLLGADPESLIRWSVQKSTVEEIAQLMTEHKLKKEDALICVDLASLESNCGKPWCAELLKALSDSKIGQYYIFGGPEEETHSFPSTPFTALPPMSIPRTAALIACTNTVITGPGALLGLSQISQCNVIPVTTNEQAAYFCKQSEKITPVIFSVKPDKDTITTILKLIAKAARLHKTEPQNIERC